MKQERFTKELVRSKKYKEGEIVLWNVRLNGKTIGKEVEDNTYRTDIVGRNVNVIGSNCNISGIH